MRVSKATSALVYVVAVSEHFDDRSGFSAAFLVGVQMFGWDGAGQHHARDRQCLAAFIIEQGVDIGDERLDPGVELKALAQTKYQAGGKRMPFCWWVHFGQTE